MDALAAYAGEYDDGWQSYGDEPLAEKDAGSHDCILHQQGHDKSIGEEDEQTERSKG